MARVIEEHRPDTVVVHEHDNEPRDSTGTIIGIIVLIVILLILLFGVRSFGGGGTVNVHTPAPTVNVPSTSH